MGMGVTAPELSSMEAASLYLGLFLWPVQTI